ncbi:MAG: HAD-IA family hydrolase [Pseudomonadota bacterium]
MTGTVSNRRAIKGLLFDKDGTLFDFAASWSGVMDRTLARLAPDADLRHQMATASGYDPVTRLFVPGSPAVAGALNEVAEIWAGFLPEADPARVTAIAEEVAVAAVSGGELSPAVPDLSGFLNGLRAQGYTLGIATHDSEEAARAHVGAFGALESFQFIAGYDSGHGLKPGPGMLLAFARSVGLSPAEIAMIGDSVHDLGVAPAAGAALAVGVLTGPATHDDLAPHADHVIPSIGALPDLLNRLAA